MSANPFSVDAVIRERHNMLSATIGDEVRAELIWVLTGDGAANTGWVFPAAAVKDFVARFELNNVQELMLLVLDVAKNLSRPPISGFVVGAVGLEAETGDLVLGANVEFPETHLGFTLHAEGFVVTRAFARGTTISTIALGEAHPCGHCRQYLSEFPPGGTLKLIDPFGHTLTLADLYPWPFDPDYLGEAGAVPGKLSVPGLAFVKDDLPVDTTRRLLAAGRRAHAPYSACPGAILLELADGSNVIGASIESVAFNPSISPLQAAVVELLAHGFEFASIRSAMLGTVSGGAVDYGASTAEMLGHIAPEAALTIHAWQI